jgi:hypothetical protein
MGLTIVQQICAEVFGYDKFMLPGYHGRPGNAAELHWEEDLIIRFLGVQVFLLGAIIVAVGALKTSIQQRCLEGAARLSSTLAGYSRRYDTDAMREALDAYELDPSCDEELLTTQRAVLQNLETFRPHLPHFLLLQLQTETTTTNDDDDKDAFGDGAADGRGESGFSTSGVSSYGGGGGSRTPESSSVWHSRAGSSVGGHGGNGRNDRSASTRMPQRRSIKPARARDGLDQRLEQLAGPALTYTGKVTYVSLLLHHVTTAVVIGRPSGKRVQTVCQMADSFVQAAAAAAEAQRGSMMCSVGDTILCAWNATGRTALPAVKACAFLTSMQDAARLLVLQLQNLVSLGGLKKPGNKLAGTVSIDNLATVPSEAASANASSLEAGAISGATVQLTSTPRISSGATAPASRTLAAAVTTQAGHCFFAGNSRRRFFTTVHGGAFTASRNTIERSALEFAAFAAATMAPSSASETPRAVAAQQQRALRVLVDAGTHEAAQFAYALWPVCVANHRCDPTDLSPPPAFSERDCTAAASAESPQAQDIAGIIATRSTIAPSNGGGRGGVAATPFALYYELGPHAAGSDKLADDNEWMYQLEARAAGTASVAAPLLGNASRQQQQQPQETQSVRDVLTSTARSVAVHLGIALGVAAGTATASQPPQRASAVDETGGPNKGDANTQPTRVPGDLLDALREIVATIHSAGSAPSHRGGSPKVSAGPPPEVAACAFFLRSAERLSS